MNQKSHACSKQRAELSLWRDRALSAEDHRAVTRHLETCSQCRGVVTDWDHIARSLVGAQSKISTGSDESDGSLSARLKSSLVEQALKDLRRPRVSRALRRVGKKWRGLPPARTALCLIVVAISAFGLGRWTATGLEPKSEPKTSFDSSSGSNLESSSRAEPDSLAAARPDSDRPDPEFLHPIMGQPRFGPDEMAWVHRHRLEEFIRKAWRDSLGGVNESLTLRAHPDDAMQLAAWDPSPNDVSDVGRRLRFEGRDARGETHIEIELRLESGAWSVSFEQFRSTRIERRRGISDQERRSRSTSSER